MTKLAPGTSPSKKSAPKKVAAPKVSAKTAPTKPDPKVVWVAGSKEIPFKKDCGAFKRVLAVKNNSGKTRSQILKAGARGSTINFCLSKHLAKLAAGAALSVLLLSFQPTVGRADTYDLNSGDAYCVNCATIETTASPTSTQMQLILEPGWTIRDWFFNTTAGSGSLQNASGGWITHPAGNYDIGAPYGAFRWAMTCTTTDGCLPPVDITIASTATLQQNAAEYTMAALLRSETGEERYVGGNLRLAEVTETPLLGSAAFFATGLGLFYWLRRRQEKTLSGRPIPTATVEKPTYGAAPVAAALVLSTLVAGCSVGSYYASADDLSIKTQDRFVDQPQPHAFNAYDDGPAPAGAGR